MADKTLQIRLSEEQYQNLEEEAAAEDRTISWVARNRMFNTDGRPRIAGPKVEQVTVSSTKPRQISDPHGPFGDPEALAPQQEMPIASDEATAVITRPADKLNAKAALTRPVVHEKSIDQERLERMNAGKYGKPK